MFGYPRFTVAWLSEYREIAVPGGGRVIGRRFRECRYARGTKTATRRWQPALRLPSRSAIRSALPPSRSISAGSLTAAQAEVARAEAWLAGFLCCQHSKVGIYGGLIRSRSRTAAGNRQDPGNPASETSSFMRSGRSL